MVAIVTGLVGAAVLAGSVAGARHDHITPGERRVFLAVNGLPGWLFWPLWPPMQLGNLVVGTAVGLGIAWADGSWRTAVAVILAVAGKLVAERLVRRQAAAYLTVRQRPGTSQPGAVLRGGDVPEEGMSFPSGHVVLVAAVAAVVTNDLTLAAAWIPAALTLAVMVGRVYVGAHNPLDVTAGLGTGMVLGALIDLALF